MSDMNHDHDLARSIHRVIRAMHDGECPRCHTIHDAMMRTDLGQIQGGKSLAHSGGWVCPSCNFCITDEEARDGLSLFNPFMDKNLEAFERWRQQRIDG